MKRLLTICLVTAIGFVAHQSTARTVMADDTLATETAPADGDRAKGPKGPKRVKGEKGNRPGQTGDRANRQRPRPTPEKLIERFDGNGDQMLSQDELPKPLQSRMEKLDGDGDGLITVEELKTTMQNVARGRQGRGGLGMERAGERPERGQRDPAKMIDRFDTDDDGMVSLDEMPEKLKDKFEKMDINADGFVDREELVAMAELRSQMGKGKGKGKNGEWGANHDNKPVVPEMPVEDVQP